MSKTLFSLAAFVATLSGSLNAAETGFIGTVNFANCITESKAGIQEQQNMENLRKQMSSLVENTEKELREINAKFEDVGRTAMIFEGFGVDHVHAKLFPMHGTKMENWQQTNSNVDKYFEKYEGYVSSHDYVRADDEQLAKLAERIRR